LKDCIGSAVNNGDAGSGIVGHINPASALINSQTPRLVSYWNIAQGMGGTGKRRRRGSEGRRGLLEDERQVKQEFRSWVRFWSLGSYC